MTNSDFQNLLLEFLLVLTEVESQKTIGHLRNFNNEIAYHSMLSLERCEHTQSKAPFVGIRMNGTGCEKEQEPLPQSS